MLSAIVLMEDILSAMHQLKQVKLEIYTTNIDFLFSLCVFAAWNDLETSKSLEHRTKDVRCMLL